MSAAPRLVRRRRPGAPIGGEPGRGVAAGVALPSDRLCATATVLTLLDAEADAGHGVSRAAAALIRGLAAAEGAPGREDAALAAAVGRLAALVREQERQLAALQTMLDAVL